MSARRQSGRSLLAAPLAEYGLLQHSASFAVEWPS